MQDVEVSGIQSVAEAAERRALSRREADDIAVERSQGFKQFTRGAQIVVTKSGDGHVKSFPTIPEDLARWWLLPFTVRSCPKQNPGNHFENDGQCRKNPGEWNPRKQIADGRQCETSDCARMNAFLQPVQFALSSKSVFFSLISNTFGQSFPVTNSRSFFVS